jgi:radical SAM protein with 4Fe4S-binding SPASM domain
MAYYIREVCIELTDKCLLNCLHCSSQSNLDGSNILAFQQCKNFLNDFSVLGGSILELSGGEPLLHPHLLSIIRLAKCLGLEVRLYTSGVTCDKNKAFKPIPREILEALRKYGLDKIIFGLQGSSQRIHEKITQTLGSFEIALESIKRAKHYDFWVGIHFVPMKLNYKNLKDIVSLAQDLSLDEVAILRFVPQGRGRLNRTQLELSEEEFSQLLEMIVEVRSGLANKAMLRIGCPLNFCSFVDPNITPQNCKAGKSTCLISAEGNVIPCPAFKDLRDFVVGNIKKQSFKDIWKSRKWQDLYTSSLQQLKRGCFDCYNFSWCKGGCTAQRIYYTGSPLKGPDPGCLALEKSLKKLVKEK